MNTIQVEADVFSGRPNPLWQLSADQAKRFMALWERLSPTTANPKRVDQLGYRGLKVIIRSTTTSHNLIIRDGIVLDVDYASHCRTDPDRNLEKWLLGTGREHLGNDLFRYLIQHDP